MAQFENESVLVQIGSILAVAVTATVFLYLLRFVYFFAKGIIHQTRSCRIPISLVGEEQRFDGRVIFIGRDGARFYPESRTTGDMLQKLLKSDGFVEFDIEVADHILPVFVDGYNNFFSPLYFLENLDRKTFREILAHSEIPPEVAVVIHPKTTKRKWRENIQSRKNRIRDIKKARSC